MNFYDKITDENALEWYGELPTHIKMKVDKIKSQYKNGRECNTKEHPDVFDKVRSELGTRPLRPADPANPLDGHTQKQIEQFELLKKWGNRYDELLLIKIITESAKGIQEERRALNEAMGLNVDANDLPNQADGLDPVQAATIRWLQLSGDTPLELLTRMYRDEEARPSDRIAAAKTLMDYVHRKIPTKQEVETKDISAPKLDPKILKGLTEKELDVLEKLLAKMASN
jgi:DNA-binding MarR family transcriptional regulator